MTQPPAADFHEPLKLALWVAANADPDSPNTEQHATSTPTMTDCRAPAVKIFIREPYQRSVDAVTRYRPRLPHNRPSLRLVAN